MALTYDQPMWTPSRFTPLFLALLLLCVRASAAEDLDVLCTTDVTAVDAALPVPSREHPIYYTGMDLGYKDLGPALASEKPPSSAEMREMLQKVLARQGYLPATPEHPATQLVTWYWGTYNVERSNTGDLSMPATQVNLQVLLAFLGGGKLGMLRDSHESGNEKAARAMRAHFEEAGDPILYDLAGRDLYVIAVGGYTLDSIVERKPILLWNSRIATAAHGHDMRAVMPKMIAIAAPSIARANAKPVWNSADKLKAEVILGEITDNKPEAPKPAPAKSDNPD